MADFGVSGFRPATLFNPAAVAPQTAATAPAAPQTQGRTAPRGVCDGFDVKKTDSDETMFNGWKQFLSNRAFANMSDAQVKAMPQRDRLNAMANEADKLFKTPDVWKQFQGSGCGFGFTPSAAKEGDIKSMLSNMSQELRDPAAAKFNSKF